MQAGTGHGGQKVKILFYSFLMRRGALFDYSGYKYGLDFQTISTLRCQRFSPKQLEDEHFEQRNGKTRSCSINGLREKMEAG